MIRDATILYVRMPIAGALGRSHRRLRMRSLVGDRIRLLGLGLLMFSLGGCSDSSREEAVRQAGSELPAPPQPAGHQRMVELLSRIAQETVEDNPYRGEV